MTDFEFIQEYRKMKKVTDLCKITGVHNSNLIAGKSTRENERKIATLCKFEIIRLYSEIIKDGVVEIGKTNSL